MTRFKQIGSDSTRHLLTKEDRIFLLRSVGDSNFGIRHIAIATLAAVVKVPIPHGRIQ